MVRFRLRFLIYLFLLAGGLSCSRQITDFNYFTADCDILDRNGQLVFHQPGGLCAFAKNGDLLVYQSLVEKLSKINAKGETLWESREIIHHKLIFDTDDKSILAIESEPAVFAGVSVRSDCFSQRDLGGKVLFKWCLSDHLEEMQKLGFRFNPVRTGNFAFQKGVVTHEISHANSIVRIEENSREKTNPAFKSGNFLVNLYGSSRAAFILDPKMKNILWTIDFSSFDYGGQNFYLSTHDLQITKDGWLLFYGNDFKVPEIGAIDRLLSPNLGMFADKTERGAYYSGLVLMDPESRVIHWMYTDYPRDKFSSPVLGSVTELKNGNFLYSDITQFANAAVVTPSGKKVWTYSDKKSPRIHWVKPLYDDSFLKARGLLD